MTEEAFEFLLFDAISKIESILNEWEPRIEWALQSNSSFVNGEMVKFVVVQSQEFLYTMQKVAKICNPIKDINFRNSNALPAPEKKVKLDADGKPIVAAKLTAGDDIESTAPFSTLGFASDKEMNEFKANFLAPYIQFTLRVVSKILPIIIIEGQSSRMPVFGLRLKQCCNQISLRMHKSVIILLKLYPGAQTHKKQSVFEKDFILYCIQNSFNMDYQQALAQVSQVSNYESVTNKLLQDGGVSNKSVKHITEQSKIVKDQLSLHISQLIQDVKIQPTFFCSNKIIESIFQTCDKYSISQVMFRQAFEHQHGSQMLNGPRWNSFLSFFSSNNQTEFDLIDLVNITDFIPISKLITLFEQDALDLCLDAVRKENARNYTLDKRLVELNHLKESVNSDHLSKKISVQQMGKRTLFIRTGEPISNNFDLTLIMYIFGMENIYLESLQIIQQATQKMQRNCNLVQKTILNQPPWDSQHLLSLNENAKPSTIQMHSEVQVNEQLDNNIPEIRSPVGEVSSQSSESDKEDNKKNKKAEVKKKKFKPLPPNEYTLQDKGFFVTFQNESEVIYLLTNQSIQEIIFKQVGDKGLVKDKFASKTFPYFVSSLLVDQMTGKNMLDKLFNLNQNFNLLNLKEIIRTSARIANFVNKEHKLMKTHFELKKQIIEKYYRFFINLVSISIDGFKSDRYQRKISDMEQNIEQAQKQLQDEENGVMKGNLDNDDMQDSLNRITGFLLKVETLIKEKGLLLEKLNSKKVKWEQSDMIFKERKQTINDLLRITLSSLTQICSDLCQPLVSNRVGEHDKALFMIDDVFIQNRIRSVQFMAEVKSLILLKQETLTDLGQTQIELASKIQFINEERLEMQKQKDEMFLLSEMKMSNDLIAEELQEQETRISNLKKVLGLHRK